MQGHDEACFPRDIAITLRAGRHSILYHQAIKASPRLRARMRREDITRFAAAAELHFRHTAIDELYRH